MAKSDPDALSWSRLSRIPLQEPKSPATENWNGTAPSEEAGVPTSEMPTRAMAAAKKTAMARLGPNAAPMDLPPCFRCRSLTISPFRAILPTNAHKVRTKGSGGPHQSRLGLATDGLRGSEHVWGAGTLLYPGEMDSLR